MKKESLRREFIFLTIVFSILPLNCSLFFDFRVSYQISSPNNELTTYIGSRTMNHWIIIEGSGKKLIDEELYFDGIEAGISDFYWHNNRFFIVKLCGYSDWAMIVVIDVEKQKRYELITTTDLMKFDWLRFNLIFEFNNEIERYSAKHKFYKDIKHNK